MGTRADHRDGSCRETLTGKHAGKWRVQFIIETPTGQRKRLSRIFGTKTDAKDFLQKLRRGERIAQARRGKESSTGYNRVGHKLGATRSTDDSDASSFGASNGGEAQISVRHMDVPHDGTTWFATFERKLRNADAIPARFQSQRVCAANVVSEEQLINAQTSAHYSAV